jgi:pimeloyl-ACP methyl ester carboxylesterase
VPRLTRPDGVEIHWRERGSGPPVLIASACFAYPGIFEPLIAELEGDHRVITYDARGYGDSTRQGPYDMATDVEDLVAVIEEGVGEPTLLVGTGDATHRVIHAAAARPDLVPAVVAPGVAPLGAQVDYPNVGEGLASSTEVVRALVQLLESDFRTGMRTAVEGANPQLDEEGMRERVATSIAYSSQESTLGRLRAWIDDDAREAARRVGDRLWILYFPGNAWFPPELRQTVSREAPEAHLERVENGALSRPDITAGYIRRLTHC